jgi:Spy/CpxP family protein refolding chaperone
MMKTRLLFSLSALALSCSVVGAAEPAPDRGPLARMEAMRERLALSDQQWSALQPLLKQEGDKVREILADTTLSTEEKRAKAREATAAGREQIKELLTPEQRQKLAEEMKNRPVGPGGGPGAGAAQRMAELKEKLGLSEEQVAKLKPVLAEEGPKLRALKEDKSLAPEERKAAFEASFERISAELTAPQREKMREEMRARRN